MEVVFTGDEEVHVPKEIMLEETGSRGLELCRVLVWVVESKLLGLTFVLSLLWTSEWLEWWLTSRYQ